MFYNPSVNTVSGGTAKAFRRHGIKAHKSGTKAVKGRTEDSTPPTCPPPPPPSPAARETFKSYNGMLTMAATGRQPDDTPPTSPPPPPPSPASN